MVIKWRPAGSDGDVQVIFLVHVVGAIQIGKIGSQQGVPIHLHHQDGAVRYGVEVHDEAGIVG